MVTSPSFCTQPLPPVLRELTPPSRWLWRGWDSEKRQSSRLHCPASRLFSYLPPAAQSLPSRPHTRGPQLGHHGASFSHGSQTPSGQLRPQHDLSYKTARLEGGRRLRAGGSASPVICSSETSQALRETPSQDQTGMRLLFRKTSICFRCLFEHSLVWFPGE